MIEQVILTKEEYQKLKEQADATAKTDEEIKHIVDKAVFDKVVFLSNEISTILKEHHLTDLGSVQVFLEHNRMKKYDKFLIDLDYILEAMFDLKIAVKLYSKKLEEIKTIPWYKRIFKSL